MDMSAPDLSALSPRQRQCLRLVAGLKSSKQIAHELSIAPSTVDGYIAEAVSILGATDRKQAALMLVEAETLPPDALGGQSSRVEETTPDSPIPSLQPGGKDSHVHDSHQPTYQVERSAFPRLFRAKGTGNDLSVTQRLVYIAGAAIFIVVIIILAVTLSDTLTHFGRAGG
ncbi:hypothetical protein GCM10023219_20690 [Stakelama sediminis]|uniref:DNA-binding CsgD family transcriptional regulator n=1 Tax=Stakelama sediminis TaxID=463200 RepID=A0A840Z2F1_9SPHN|nr:helix-turn-helix transcriptional regulator [Stakelama sediminis]MBB5719937.1 DNA-binding CsgD family transcriptional regulator [Stakelama sediminis]